MNITLGQAIQSPLIDQLIRRLPRPLELLVLYPMSRLNGAEENSNAVGTAMINAAERIAREVGCTVLIMHHTGKAAAKGRDESLYSARGAETVDSRCVIKLVTRQNLYPNYRNDDYFLQKMLQTELIFNLPEELAQKARTHFNSGGTQ